MCCRKECQTNTRARWNKGTCIYICNGCINSYATVYTQYHSTYRPLGKSRLERNGGHTAKVDTGHGQEQNMHEVNDDRASQGSLRLCQQAQAAAHLAMLASGARQRA